MVDWGKYGVTIFFVISGFTIFNQIYGRKYTLRNFLAVRLTRVSLPYFPLLLIVYLYPVFITGGAREITFDNLLVHYTYLSFLSIKYSNTIIGVEWTLAIEVFYYFLIGLLISSVFFKKSPATWSFLLGIMLFIVYKASEGVISKGYANYLTIHWSPMKYGFMFLLGGAVYFIRKVFEENYSQQQLSRCSDIALLLISVLIISNLIYQYIISFEMFFALVTFMFLVCVRDTGRLSVLLTNRVMVFAGSISFSFYLWHTIIIRAKYLSIDFIQADVQYNFIYRLFLTTIVSVVWYLIFERYFYKKIKSRILKPL